MSQKSAAITTKLASAYTKAVLHNPKDTVYANIERAVVSCPYIVRACNAHDDLVAALETVQRNMRNSVKGQQSAEGWRMVEKALAKAKAVQS